MAAAALDVNGWLVVVLLLVVVDPRLVRPHSSSLPAVWRWRYGARRLYIGSIPGSIPGTKKAGSRPLRRPTDLKATHKKGTIFRWATPKNTAAPT